jgi:hypothetical protein
MKGMYNIVALKFISHIVESIGLSHLVLHIPTYAVSLHHFAKI